MRIVWDGGMEEEYAWRRSENGVRVRDERVSTHCAITVRLCRHILVVLCDYHLALVGLLLWSTLLPRISEDQNRRILRRNRSFPVPGPHDQIMEAPTRLLH